MSEVERLIAEVERMRPVYDAAVALADQPMLRLGKFATPADVARSKHTGPHLLKRLLDAVAAAEND